MLRRQLLSARETPANRVVHPDVFVEFFPAQSQSMQAERDLFELSGRGIGEQRIFAGRKTDQPLIGQFQPDAAVFHPTAHCGSLFWLSFHEF